MAGRHRRPNAWRRLLTSMVRSRDRARTAALQAEVVALRSLVAELREELVRVRAEAGASAAATAPAAAAAVAAAAPAAELAEVRWVTLQMPLVQLALGDPADLTKGPEVAAALAHPDRGEDTAETEIVLDPALEPAAAPAAAREPAAVLATPAAVLATPAAVLATPADRLAWTVLANLPERPLLDPRSDRDSEPRDPAATAAPTQHRRTA
jgi:hypothetical protein